MLAAKLQIFYEISFVVWKDFSKRNRRAYLGDMLSCIWFGKFFLTNLLTLT